MNDAARSELSRLKAASRDGMLHQEQVITAARSKRSPLHQYFTWDSTKALEKNLKREAQELIREYTVVVMLTDGTAVRTRHLVSLSSDRASGGGYRAVKDVFENVDQAQQLLRDALTELGYFKARYKRLVALGEVFTAIEKVTAKHARRKPGEPDKRASA